MGSKLTKGSSFFVQHLINLWNSLLQDITSGINGGLVFFKDQEWVDNDFEKSNPRINALLHFP